MFQKITLILFTFIILVSSQTSLSTSATDAKFAETDSRSTSLWAGKTITFPSDENLTSEPIDEEQDSVETDSNLPSICSRPGSCPIVGTSKSEIEDFIDEDSTSICNGPCPITKNSNFIGKDTPNSNEFSTGKSANLKIITSVLRYIVFVITGLSFLAILGGLIATIIMSILKKKFAVTPFIVFGIGILFLVVSIICTTIISLTSFL